MKLRVALSMAILAAFLLATREAAAQATTNGDSSSQDIKSDDLPSLPISSGRSLDLLLPPQSQVSTAPQRPEESRRSVPQAPNIQLSGDFRKQNARVYFEQMSEDRKHKHRVEITLRNGARLEGRILSVETEGFRMRVDSTNQETGVNFDDVDDWRSARKIKNETVLNVLSELAWLGQGVLSIFTLPVLIFESARGCGCS